MYDIYLIGQSNWSSYRNLKKRFPTAKHAQTVQEAKQKCLTKFVWIVYHDLVVHENFDFKYVPDEYSQDMTHVFINERPYYTEDFYDGVALMPKNSHHGPGELKSRFYVNKKFVPIVASRPRIEKFDAVFISYNEPNADENYERILERFPDVKRVHGVKGIHNAHIAAAEICDTDMFWIVDGDAQIVDDFNFQYQVPKWQRDQVFVWHSRNPINDLEYGYGGVKLFPRKETLAMDTNSTDMSTSISPKFNVVDQVSNVTAFNTGEFETWKSAFRECAKLSSGIINRQENEETEQRLHTWCTVGNDREYSEFAISGACAGREFGYANRDNKNTLSFINNFDWLKAQFKGA